jgi:hypothetical protein
MGGGGLASETFGKSLPGLDPGQAPFRHKNMRCARQNERTSRFQRNGTC